jgi:hypothetical protein
VFIHFVTVPRFLASIGDSLMTMTLEQFAQKLQPMLKNPNAVTTDGVSLWLFTNDQEWLELTGWHEVQAINAKLTKAA